MAVSRDERNSGDILAALERLSQSSSHEVSNTLTAVLGYLDLAKGQLNGTHPSSDAIEKATVERKRDHEYIPKKTSG